MGWGLLFAILAALCTAGATIMQAIGARRVRHFRAVDPRLLLSVIKSGLYVSGLVLLAISFGLTLVSLYSVPLFVVQAIGAASIAVLAGLSKLVYGTKLTVMERTAVAAVFAGVILLVIAQHSSTHANLPAIGQWALLGAAVLLGVLAFTGIMALSGVAVPGFLAGIAFGDAAVAGRVLADLDRPATSLLINPATYAIVVAGLLGTLLYATALQRGSVTAVFGVSTVGQTFGPAVTGYLLLGDSVRPGMLPIAVIGFLLAIGGALVLGRHAYPEREREFRREIVEVLGAGGTKARGTKGGGTKAAGIKAEEP
jgi:drug/metabolite transporter (DMT)-like permease